jgi:uncharacterized protein (TIGR01777 family)
MKVLIAGSSGLIGAAVSSVLREQGHAVVPLIRPPQMAGLDRVAWNPETGEMDVRVAARSDAVINLAGVSIAGVRWSGSRKELLRSSRIDSTRNLVEPLARLDPRPKAFISASAVGYYGDRGDEVLTEESAPGDGFLAKLVRDWEAEAKRAEEFGIRTVILRFGVVLTAKGGALAQMLPPFQAGMGGRLGSGRQWMSWISLADVVGVIREALVNEGWRGIYNVVAPNPVTNLEFTRTLSNLLDKRAMFRVPAIALRVVYGEIADEMLLASQRIEPKRLIQDGYSYHYRELEPALANALTGA